MTPDHRRLLNRYATLAIPVAGVVLGVVALILLGRYASSLADFGRRHVLLLAVNVAAVVVLLVVILVNLVRLVGDYRRRAPGARLRARLVAMFVGLTLAPLFVVYFFALQFVNGGIDSWFDSDLEQELSSALKLSRESLEVQAASRLSQTTALASALGNLDGEALSRALSVLRADANADELTVFTPGLRVAASSSRTTSLPPSLSEDTLAELAQHDRFMALEPLGGARYQVRAAVPMPGEMPGDEAFGGRRYLQAVFPIGYRQGRLADAVQDTYTRYTELRFLREPLKDNLTLTLSLVLLLSLLSAATGAFYLARRLAAPIQSLAAGTEAVAKGDFDTRLPPGAADEVGFLIESFNGMIERLKQAREEARLSQEQLLLAQREAAWGEVARRLAHEIKNPLTPIRLAAERIRRRYLPAMSPDDGQILDRSTHTIVQQVEAMRDMVNSFSEYARAPAVSITRVDLGQVVREVAWLYRAQEGQPVVKLELEDGLEVEADAVRVRQLLHNLIRNAQDALEGHTDGVIDIRARSVPGGERAMAEITVADNGPGIDAEMLTRLFEPYVTSKKKGTGLGLAIVKKLVEEHGGTVAAENLPERGARLAVRLPVRAAVRDASSEARPVRAEPWRERA